MARSYGDCPRCGFECWQDVQGDRGEPNMVCTKNYRKTDTDYGPGADWTEVWLCPGCGHQFEERNGYP